MSEPSHNNSDILLEPPLVSTLQTGLTLLPTPSSQPDFNQQVLRALTSGREYDAWPQQALRRLHWMLIPMILGFTLTITLAIWLSRWLPSGEVTGSQQSHSVLAPPLPPIPDSLIEPKKHPYSAQEGR